MQEKGIAPKDVYTWEELRDLCLAISDPAKRRFGWGMTVNRSGDGNGMIEALINSYGGSIASNDGRKVTFDSPETVQAVTFLGDIYTNPKYKPMLPPGVAAGPTPATTRTGSPGSSATPATSSASTRTPRPRRTPSTTTPTSSPTASGRRPTSPCCSASPRVSSSSRAPRTPALAKLLAQYLVSAPALLGVAKEAPGLAMPAWEKVWDADPFFTSGDPAFPMLRKITQQSLPLTTKNGLAFPQKASAGQQAAVGGLRPHRHDAAGRPGNGARAGRDRPPTRRWCRSSPSRGCRSDVGPSSAGPGDEGILAAGARLPHGDPAAAGS